MNSYQEIAKAARINAYNAHAEALTWFASDAQRGDRKSFTFIKGDADSGRGAWVLDIIVTSFREFSMEFDNDMSVKYDVISRQQVVHYLKSILVETLIEMEAYAERQD